MGPPAIRDGAKVIDMDADGNMTVLREGTNGWTCMPGVETARADMCADEMGMQWIMDAWAGKPRPTNTSPGLIYMLNGAVQHSYTDPFDRTSPLIPIGAHWMLIWPFDAEATGLSTVMRDAGTMIMYAGTPYAHLHICGDPWEGNEYHPDSEAVWTMTYRRIRFPAAPPRESRTDVALSLWRATMSCRAPLAAGADRYTAPWRGRSAPCGIAQGCAAFSTSELHPGPA